MSYKTDFNNIEKKIYDSSTDELKNQLYGYFSTIILSKKYACSNKELPLMMSYFDLEFLPYAYKSRTTLLSKVIRIIEKKDEEELMITLKTLSTYLSEFESDNLQVGKEIKKPKNKQKESKNIFDNIFDHLG